MPAFMCVSNTYNLDSGYDNYVTALEGKLGRTFAGFRMNGGFTRSGDWPEMDKWVSAGRTWTYVNGKPDGTVSGYWKAVAAGKMDGAFHTFMQKVVSDGRWSPARPFHYSFHHEQSVSAEGGGSQAGSAADYAAAWNHVMGLVRSANAHVSQGGPFKSCWVPHWLQVSRDSKYAVTSNKPSAAVVGLLASKIASGLDKSLLDIVGADIYVTTSQNTGANEQWTPLHKLGLDVGKPIMTGETGVAGTDAKVQKYLSDLHGLITQFGTGNGAGQLHSVCWTSRLATRFGTGNYDYRMDSTPAKLAAFRTFVNSPEMGARL